MEIITPYDKIPRPEGFRDCGVLHSSSGSIFNTLQVLLRKKTCFFLCYTPFGDEGEKKPLSLHLWTFECGRAFCEY